MQWNVHQKCVILPAYFVKCASMQLIQVVSNIENVNIQYIPWLLTAFTVLVKFIAINYNY